LVSFSVNSSVGLPSTCQRSRPNSAWRASIAPLLLSAISGFSQLRFQLHVLRNHICGSTCNGAASGPRLVTVICISTSPGSACAYSTTTSK
jgi:hypothetical protein